MSIDRQRLKVQDQSERHRRLTTLEAIVLFGGMATSMWLFGQSGATFEDVVHPEGLEAITVALAIAVAGLALVGPIVLGVQFLRGRRDRLLSGEIAWAIMGPVWFATTLAGLKLPPYGTLWILYSEWLISVFPPLIICIAILSFLDDIRRSHPRQWSHRFGLGITLAEVACVLAIFAALLMGT